MKSTRVDLRLPSRVELILLTSTTGFVGLTRFRFKLIQVSSNTVCIVQLFVTLEHFVVNNCLNNV